MKRDALIFIEHILESINKIKEYTNKITKEKLEKDTKIQDAIIRRIEVVGEAAKNIPNDFKKKYSEIEWSEIVRTRDKMIHHYFGIDLDIVWDIIKEDIPKLEKQIKKILEKN